MFNIDKSQPADFKDLLVAGSCSSLQSKHSFSLLLLYYYPVASCDMIPA